jgi:hypothetical protein
MMADSTGGDRRIDPIDAWLGAALADAERRGLPELKPLLEGLARSTRQLRAAEWNDCVPTGGKAGDARAPGGKAEGGR